ncbi:MAG: hypothetical protein WCH39_01630 [Schlesneria sp.]
MKSTTVIQIHADLSGFVPENYRTQIRWVNECGRLLPVYPIGTVFEGDHAVFAVKAGQATPSDVECQAACGLNNEEIASQQLEYEMTAKGINNPKDRDLYKSGVILGYEQASEGQMVVIKGPNYDAYQKSKEEAQNVGNV